MYSAFCWGGGGGGGGAKRVGPSFGEAPPERWTSKMVQHLSCDHHASKIHKGSGIRLWGLGFRVRSGR